MSKITFIEHQVSGYPARTIENIKLSQCTIAIAKDFNSPGERLTKRTCYERGCLYIPVDLTIGTIKRTDIVDLYKTREINTLNIAGNGIYNVPYSQKQIDSWVIILLESLFKYVTPPQSIRSGGQTGIDEAGLKAASYLGIPATCLAPKGWLFRDETHLDIADENKFKARFKDYL